jgi:ATP-dependent protease HslVU (ClpYQ) ATPase subunit
MSKIQQEVINKINLIESTKTDSSKQISEMIEYLNAHKKEIKNDKDAYHSLLKTMSAKLDEDVVRAVCLEQSLNQSIDMIEDIEKYITRGEQSKKDRTLRKDDLE